MPEVPEQGIVEARINVNASPMTVTLKGHQAGLRPKLTFRVQGGSTVTWKLLDANGQSTGLAARVRFDTPLFQNRNVFKGTDTIKSELVDPGVAPRDPIQKGTPTVEFHYHFDLETPPDKFTELVCLWTDGSTTGMGGGEKGPKP